MTPLERARDFAKGAFGPFGVNIDPYATIIAELIEGAIEQERAEIERLRARGDILHEALVDIISYRCNGWNHACEIARKAMDDAMHAYEQSPSAWSRERCLAVDRSNIPETCDWPRCCGGRL